MLSGKKTRFKIRDSAICGFASYFKYKDYFSGKEMIAVLCAMYEASFNLNNGIITID